MTRGNVRRAAFSKRNDSREAGVTLQWRPAATTCEEQRAVVA